MFRYTYRCDACSASADGPVRMLQPNQMPPWPSPSEETAEYEVGGKNVPNATPKMRLVGTMVCCTSHSILVIVDGDEKKGLFRL